jgi:hypothetical protein
MQPRRDLSWADDGSTVFQVTKRGDSVICEEEEEILRLLDEGVVWAVVGAREEDEEPGVEVSEDSSR